MTRRSCRTPQLLPPPPRPPHPLFPGLTARAARGTTGLPCQVDCTEHVGRCSEAEVDGYPTLKLFAGDSSPIEYTGGRSLTGFEHFVAEHSGRFKASGVAGSVTEDGLFQLADGSFTPAVQSGFTFVKFFAPWCGHCKAMQPAWVELARSYRHHADIKIAEVDCIANKATCSTAQIRGYPTLNLYFQGQELAKYKGGRTVDAFRAFLSEHTDRDGEATAGAGPPAGEEAWNPDQSDLVDLSDANFAPAVETGYWFVKFYAPWCGHCKRLAPVWQRVAAEAFPYTDGRVTIARVDCTESEAVCDAQGVSGYPALWLFKDGQKVAEYDGEREFDDIREYVASVIEDDADPAHDEL